MPNSANIPQNSCWFRPRRYGYGAYPCNWKGWAFTTGFLVLFLGWTAFMLLPLSAPGHEPGSTRWMLWLGLGLIAAIVFAKISRKKTDGPWGWRWAGKPIGRQPQENN
jgi:hypothetical protein